MIGADPCDLVHEKQTAGRELAGPSGQSSSWVLEVREQQMTESEIRCPNGKARLGDIARRECGAASQILVCSGKEAPRCVKPNRDVWPQHINDELGRESGATAEVQRQGRLVRPFTLQESPDLRLEYARDDSQPLDGQFAIAE